ncbi:MAG: hypothetical protein ACE5IR_12005 [bacterium]
MLKHILGVLLFYAIFSLTSVVYSQSGKIKGYMFGDYYYVAQNNDTSLESRNGFWFRRIYLTYDHKLNDEFAVRFRIELNSPGDFTARSKLEPFLKDGYLKWAKSRHAIIIGLSPTPTWNYIEKIWGYRSVEKTPADLYKFGSSRDLGVAFQGSFDREKRLRYHFMFSNGSSTRAETNKGKKLLLALGYQLTPELSVEVYGDWEERPGKTNRYSAQGFLGYRKEKLRLGAQLLHQTRQQEGEDEELQLLSVFGAAQLEQKLWAFLRYDRSFDPISAGPTISYIPFNGGAKFNFVLAGLDFSPHKQVHFMPNVELTFYDEVAGERPDTDLIPRFTFYYIWK